MLAVVTVEGVIDLQTVGDSGVVNCKFLFAICPLESGCAVDVPFLEYLRGPRGINRLLNTVTGFLSALSASLQSMACRLCRGRMLKEMVRLHQTCEEPQCSEVM